MDPLNPIIPGQGLLAPAARVPAVPRVSPDEQRERTRDERQPEQDAEDEESFEHVLDDDAQDGVQAPAALDPELNVIADAVMVAGESLDAPLDIDAWDTEAGDVPRADDDTRGPDDGRDDHPHIDITA